jgi:hypothetical protein
MLQMPDFAHDCLKGGSTSDSQTLKPSPPQKWTGLAAAPHIWALILSMSDKEKEKLEESTETEGLGF